MYYITYSIHVTSYPLYLWYHIHYVWQHNTVCFWYRTWHMCDIICTTDDIKSTLSHQNHHIYDVTSTLGMASQPQYQTSYPLYLCHHKLSTDIIPTFVWHHSNYKCEIICTLYNIISTPYVFTFLYLWHHSLYIWNYIQHVGPHIHYTCDITATIRCHHSHCIDNITHTLYGITLTICLVTFALYKTSHTCFMISSHHF